MPNNRTRMAPGGTSDGCPGEKPNNWILGPKGLKSRQTQFQRHNQCSRIEGGCFVCGVREILYRGILI